MAKRNLVVIGASAGGIRVLQQILADLPKVNAAILVVIHISPNSDSVLPQILERAGNLPAVHAEDWAKLEKGKIFVAPPDCHMVVEDGHVRITKGPKENHHRPAIDPLFRSAAVSHGPRVIGVILTGSLDDGTVGLRTIRERGGKAIIQDPSTALFSSMPLSALELVPDAAVLSVPQIAPKLVELLMEELPEPVLVLPRNGLPERETRFAELDMSEIESENHPGRPSSFACPDCGGVLWEIDDNSFLRFRCRVGHAYTARYLAAEQRTAIETALWSALRALEESGALYKRLAERARNPYHPSTVERFEERADNTLANARILRDFLTEVTEDAGVEEPT